MNIYVQQTLKEEEKWQLLKKQKAEEKRKWLTWLGNHLNTWGFMTTLLAFSLSTGVLVGVNLPTAVGCLSSDSLCYRLRFLPLKVILENKKNGR